MSSLATSPYSNNILACGYIREYENDTLLMVPSGVQLIIAMFCRQDIIYGIGCNDYQCSFDINSNKSSYHQIHSNLINDQIINGYGININSIYSELYKYQKYQKYQNKSDKTQEKIQLLSTSSLLKNTDLYIYTDDNNLYKSSLNMRSVSTFAKYRHPYQRNINVSNTTLTSIQPMSLAKIEPFILSNDDIIVDIKCGLHHTLFLTKSGNVFSYGLNDVGQCGFNKDKFVHITTPKLMATNIKAIACGSFHNLLINNNDELVVCGYNYCGQCGVTTIEQDKKDENNYNNNNTNDILPNFNSSDSGDSFISNASNTSKTSIISSSMTQTQQNISIRYDQYIEFEMVDTSDSDAMDDDDDDTLLNGFAFQDDSDEEDDDDDNDDSDNDEINNRSTQQSGTNTTNKSANTVPIKKKKNILCVDIPTKNKYFMDLGLKIAKIDCGKFHSLVITKDGKCFTFGSNAFGNLGNGEESEWGATNPIPYQIQIQFETEHHTDFQCKSSQSMSMSTLLFPPKTESIIDGSCGENHNLLLTKSNKIIAFGDNSNHQCSMIEEDKLLKPFIICKEKELNLASNILIEKVFCSQNESLIFINPYSRC